MLRLPLIESCHRLGKGHRIRVREKRGRNEFVHKGRVITQLQVRHHEGNPLRFLQEILGEGEKPCAQEGAIANKNKFIDLQFRKKTDEDCLFKVEVAAKSPCDDDLIQVFEFQADTLQQDLAPRIDRCLGSDQIFDIDLGEDDILFDVGFFLPGQDILIAFRTRSVGRSIRNFPF